AKQYFRSTRQSWSKRDKSRPQVEVRGLKCAGEAMEKSNLTKSPNPIDKHVGSRVRMRRMMLGMSQEKLGEELGLTFQQVQKYEKGTNRISASRLQHISNILQVTVPFFFEGAPGQREVVATSDYVSEFLATSAGLALIKAFIRIKDAKLRRAIVALVEEIADNEG